MSRATVLLADDHPVVAEGLASLLWSEFTVVSTVTDGVQLLEAARRLRPDLIVTDITMPRMSGLEALHRLKTDGLTAKVIMLTIHANAELAAEALRAGASGFLVKDAASTELVDAIRSVLRGKTYLSSEMSADVVTALVKPATERRERLTLRQRDVLRLLADGRTMKEVAATLNVSPRTVEKHKYQIMDILGIGSTAELVRYAVAHGLTTPPAPG